MGELAYFRFKAEQAIAWIKAHPLAAARFTGLHIFYFWFPFFPSLPKTLLSAGITLLGILGILNLARYRMLLAGALLSFSLIYTVTIADNRYRYPIYPVLLLLSFSALARLVPSKLLLTPPR
jgi:hypothetical protein